MSNVKIILKGKSEKELEGYRFITGFRTLGEVGYLAVRHLVLQMKMKKVGYIITKYLRDVAFIDDYGFATPFELFIDENNKLLLLLNHILPYHREWNYYTRGIVRWLKKIGVRDAIFIGGLDKSYRVTNSKLSWLKTSKCNINLNYPLMDKYLLIVGPLALLTIYAEIEDLPAVVLLPYAERDRADPAAAAVAVEVISDILSIKVDVSALYEDAKRIEEELQKQMEILQSEMAKGSLGRGGYM